MSFLALQAGPAEVILASYGAQALSWRHRITPILYEGSSPKRSGIPLLFPFADPLKNETLIHTNTQLPQHGFARNVEWTLTQLSEGTAQATLASSQLPEEWRAKYPYEFESNLTLSLEADDTTTRLTYNWQVQNLDTKPLPTAPGLHPYFPLPHEEKSRLRTEPALDLTPLATDKELETGLKYPYTDVQVKLPNYQLHITTDPHPDLFVAWSQPPSLPDSNFVCLEPFMRTTNGINENPIWVQPNKVWRWRVTFEVQTVPANA